MSQVVIVNAILDVDSSSSGKYLFRERDIE
jgi:hypothetical protein